MGLLRDGASLGIALCVAAGLLFSISIADAADINKINKLAQECKSGKEKSCSKLAEIARNDKDMEIRLAAIKKVTDQSVLADLAQNDEDWNIRSAAIKCMTDSVILAEIAENDKTKSFSYVLAKNPYLIDQGLLADIAKTTREKDIGLAAIEKITDQGLLADIVMINNKEEICLAAVEKLADQVFLANIVKNSNDNDIQKAALNKLIDPILLSDLAKNSKSGDFRALAIQKTSLTDQILLTGIANNDEDAIVREAAVAKLDSQALLAEIAKNDKAWNVRHAAVENPNLNDHVLLGKLAENDKSDSVRKAATKKLPENHRLRKIVLASQEEIKEITEQGQLADIAKSAAESSSRRAALEKIIDQALLADIARNALAESIRSDALRRLESQEKLMSFSKDIKQPLNLRLMAITILRDSEHFKITENQIVEALLEIRQEAIKKKDLELYKEIHWELNRKKTPEAIIEIRKRLPKAVIQGRLIKRESGEPLANTPLFLGEMKGLRECMLYSDLMTTTDDKGNFVIKGVPNGFYTVVYSLNEKPRIPASAVFTLDSKEFDASKEYGLFNEYNTLTEGTSTIISMQLDISLSFEVREASIVEFDVFGTGIRKLEFEIYK